MYHKIPLSNSIQSTLNIYKLKKKCILNKNAFQDAYRPLIDRMPGEGVLPSGGCLLPEACADIPACTEADPPPVGRITDTRKNITLATTSLRPVKNFIVELMVDLFTTHQSWCIILKLISNNLLVWNRTIVKTSSLYRPKKVNTFKFSFVFLAMNSFLNAGEYFPEGVSV